MGSASASGMAACAMRSANVGPSTSSITRTRSSTLQSGALLPLPVIKIGGATATVQFAGLVAPGEFQFNVVVPSNAPDGDQAITAIYNGLTTQSGVLLTLQH